MSNASSSFPYLGRTQKEEKFKRRKPKGNFLLGDAGGLIAENYLNRTGAMVTPPAKIR